MKHTCLIYFDWKFWLRFMFARFLSPYTIPYHIIWKKNQIEMGQKLVTKFIDMQKLCDNDTDIFLRAITHSARTHCIIIIIILCCHCDFFIGTRAVKCNHNNDTTKHMYRTVNIGKLEFFVRFNSIYFRYLCVFCVLLWHFLFFFTRFSARIYANSHLF